MSLASVSSTPLRLMSQSVLVTYIISPLNEVRLPPVILNEELPTSASPDML